MTVEADWFSAGPDETVIWTGQPRVWRIWKACVGALVLAIVAVAVAYYLTTTTMPPVEDLPSAVIWGVAVLLVLAGGARAVGAYLRVVYTDYVLTDKRVYRKDGILSEHVSNVGVDRVQETTLSKDITGNLFDYGTVAISTAGSGGTDLALTDLTDPETFRDHLREQARASGGTEPAGAEAAIDADTADALLAEARGLREVAERLEESI
jgi:uncharacterized membrane protein YdbT with pleckstrin-like domain